MADIVRKPAGQELVAPTEWNPFRAMREWLRWDPFRELAPIVPSNERMAFAPNFDVTENKDAYLFKADVPGVKREDLEITTLGNRLQVTGKRDFEEEKQTDTIYTYERQYGNFTRSFTLPDGVDLTHAKSELKDGVLTIVIPKLARAQAKKIEVTAEKVKP